VSVEEQTVTPPRRRRRACRRAVALATLTLLLAGCDPRDSMTAPVAPEAGDIAGLWWFIFWLGLVVYIVVMALLAVPLWRTFRRRRAHDEARPAEPAAASGGGGPHHGGRALDVPPAAIEDEPLAVAPDSEPVDTHADRKVSGRLIWLGGVIVPAIILLILLVAAMLVSRSVAHVAEDDDLVIDVVGHMFWWEVHYPDHDITTANEIHVPTGERVRLRLHTEDVIHSFWIPRVHGKIDMIPGQENILTFTVEEPGRYRGQCAEYCGIAHAQMVKFLVAQEPDEFDAWASEQAAPADEPDTDAAEEGRRAFFEYGCADCHAVDGHGAVAQEGPDLTHLATRDSLASGIVPNDREHLAELILDPWVVKAGNPMPPTEVPEEDLEALLDYLEGLE
jgi:cytochrome c oxidase subunit II